VGDEQGGVCFLEDGIGEALAEETGDGGSAVGAHYDDRVTGVLVDDIREGVGGFAGDC